MSLDGVSKRDLYVLSAGATGAAINKTDDTEDLKSMLLFMGGVMAAPTAAKLGKKVVWDAPKWGIKNYRNYKQALTDLYNKNYSTLKTTNIFKANRDALKGHFWSDVKNSKLYYEPVSVPKFNTQELESVKRELTRKASVLEPKAGDNFLKATSRYAKKQLNDYKLVKNANALKKAEIYENANQLAKEAENLTGKRLAVKLRQIKKANTEAKIAINEAKAAGEIKSATKLGKAASYIKTKTGIRAAQNKLLKGTLSTNKTVRLLSKGVKAGGTMAVISAAMEVPTVIDAYKNYGGKVGTKQLAQSTVKVAADTAGFVVGAKLGAIAGAKLGATVGTCIGGPIGTAIGGAIGTVIGIGCGLLGSWLAGKTAKAVVGEDAIEQAKKQEAMELAESVENDAEAQAQLAALAQEKLENGDFNSEEDAIEIAKGIDKVAKSLSNGNSHKSDKVSAKADATAPSTSSDGLQALKRISNNTYMFTNNAFTMPNMNYNFNPFNTGFNPFMMNNTWGYAA